MTRASRRLELARFRAELTEEACVIFEAVLDRFRDEEMRAFDLGCFPWHGYLNFSFLTVNEPSVPTQTDPPRWVDLNAIKWAPETPGKFEHIAEWRLFDFCPMEVRSERHRRLEDWMKQQWLAAEDERLEFSDRLFQSCAIVLKSDRVTAMLAKFRLTPDFEVSVFDPDGTRRENYCTIY